MSRSRFPVADAHGDLLVEIEFRGVRPDAFGDLWLEQLREGEVSVQVCALWAGARHQPEAALRVTLAQAVAARRAVALHPELALITRGSDLQCHEGIGLVLAMEGCEPLSGDPAVLDAYWALGVRIYALTWANRNMFADGNAERADAGLSSHGRSLLSDLVQRGAVIDLAHASPRTFDQGLQHLAHAPVLVSHAGCRTLHDDPRNLDDARLRALADRGGLLGVMAHPIGIGPERSVDRVIDHALHAIDTMGVEHVCMGGDFARQITRSGALGLPWQDLRLPNDVEFDAAIEGLESPRHYPRLAERMLERGLDESEVRAVLADNLIEFLSRSLPAS